MMTIVFIFYRVIVWNYDITNQFLVKYIICGTIFSLFLPYIYYNFKKVRFNSKKK